VRTLHVIHYPCGEGSCPHVGWGARKREEVALCAGKSKEPAARLPYPLRLCRSALLARVRAR
jgi:hypothetical protein